MYELNSMQQSMECSVFHLNDSLSQVILKLPVDVFNNGGKPNTKLRITYSLLYSFKDSRIADSLSIEIQTTPIIDQSALQQSAVLKTSLGQDYILFVKVEDLNTKKERICIKPFSKINHATAAWFKAEDEFGSTLGNQLIPYGEQIRIKASDTLLNRIYCRAFFRTFPPADPPFIMKERTAFDYIPDSLFTLPLINGQSEYISLDRPGFCIFQIDTSNWEGYSLQLMPTGFPELSSYSSMLEALRLLTSNEEFAELRNLGSAKDAVDKFWLTVTGSPERAIQRIRDFYNRLALTNELFTSYCEGWKTDRGLIYLIFGPPNLVYRSDLYETWTYGEANNYRSMQFVFYKVDNPFTEQDYILQRQPNYKTYWYNAVEQWRR